MKTKMMTSIVIAFFGLLLCACNGNSIPNTGPVFYPPTWPMSEIIAPAGAQKAPITFYKNVGQNTEYYIEAMQEENLSDPSVIMTTWQFCFYYDDGVRELFDYVEQCLNEGGYEWKYSLNSGAQLKDWHPGGCADMGYVVTRDDVDGFYWLSVSYNGYRTPRDVDITIILEPRKHAYQCN